MTFDDWNANITLLEHWTKHITNYQAAVDAKYTQEPSGSLRLERNRCNHWLGLLEEMKRWADNQYANSK